MELTTLIFNGTISIQDLANAPQLIERAKFVKEGVEACQKVLLFPFGKREIQCYSYSDTAEIYRSWGVVNHDGILTCYRNYGSDHELGKVDLTDPRRVFMALENEEFASDLKRFLSEQIEKAKA